MPPKSVTMVERAQVPSGCSQIALMEKNKENKMPEQTEQTQNTAETEILHLIPSITQ